MMGISDEIIHPVDIEFALSLDECRDTRRVQSMPFEHLADLSVTVAQ